MVSNISYPWQVWLLLEMLPYTEKGVVVDEMAAYP